MTAGIPYSSKSTVIEAGSAPACAAKTITALKKNPLVFIIRFSNAGDVGDVTKSALAVL
jgi:hypothetical protein